MRLPSATTTREPNRIQVTKTEAILLTGYLVIASLGGYLSLSETGRAPLAVLILLAICGVVAILLRRRYPTLVFAAALSLAVISAAWGSAAEFFLVIIEVFAYGLRHGGHRSWTALAAALAGSALAGVVLAIRLRVGPSFLGLVPRTNPDGLVTDALNCAGILAVTVLIVGLLGMNLGHRRRYVTGLVDRAERMRRERDQQATIQAALERERIAREMHDVIAHSLSVMIALADGAKAAVPARPDEAQAVIGRVADTGRRTLGEVRRLLTQVRDGDEYDQPEQVAPGLEHITELVDEFRVAGLPIRFEIQGTLHADPALGLTVYRIVQESLTNTLRHASDVRDVLVRLDLGAREQTVLVKDHSAPVGAQTGPGRGLVGIRERGALYDGEVEIGPREGGGWRVFVRLHTEEDS